MSDEIFDGGAEKVEKVSLDPLARELVGHRYDEEVVVQLASFRSPEPGLKSSFAQSFAQPLGDRGPKSLGVVQE